MILGEASAHPVTASRAGVRRPEHRLARHRRPRASGGRPRRLGGRHHLVHRPLGLGQVDGRDGRGPAAGGGRPAPPTCSTATTSATASTATSASTAAGREENVRRVGEVARLMADAGRRGARPRDQPLPGRPRPGPRASTRRPGCASSRCSSTRRSRSANSATRRASTPRPAAGELTGFTGIDDPYEPPLHADLVLRTTTARPAAAGGSRSSPCSPRSTTRSRFAVAGRGVPVDVVPAVFHNADPCSTNVVGTAAAHAPPQLWRAASVPLTWALQRGGGRRPPLPVDARRQLVGGLADRRPPAVRADGRGLRRLARRRGPGEYSTRAVGAVR